MQYKEIPEVLITNPDIYADVKKVKAERDMLLRINAILFDFVYRLSKSNNKLRWLAKAVLKSLKK